SSGAISTLTERILITVVGRSQTVGNPLLFGTTREFLNPLGLKGIGQLPDLPDIEDFVHDRDQLRDFANQIGREVSDEDLEDYFSAPEEGVEAELPADPDEAADSPDPSLPDGPPEEDAGHDQSRA
ncbi:MAG: SMC-Scp complex subunit ScpB, partial [Candidatus Krumholzibacteriia bacterium]